MYRIKNHVSSLSFSQGKAPIIQIILFVVAVIIIVPILGASLLIGSISSSCDNRTSDLDNQALEVNKKLESMTLPTAELTSRANGDCLTGSGTSYNFSVEKNYASPLEAKNDIIKSIESVGLPAPKSNQEPEYIFASNESTSGWDTPIKQIKFSYQLGGNDDLEFTIVLDQLIPCTATSDSKILCAGEEQDVLITKILASQPISSIQVNGSVRYE